MDCWYLCPGCFNYGWFDICVLVVVVMDGLISVFWLLYLWIVGICVLVVLIMDGLISVSWLL